MSIMERRKMLMNFELHIPLTDWFGLQGRINQPIDEFGVIHGVFHWLQGLSKTSRGVSQ
jgi:hypothetical protein